jgi:hypothetical protein
MDANNEQDLVSAMRSIAQKDQQAIRSLFSVLEA